MGGDKALMRDNMRLFPRHLCTGVKDKNGKYIYEGDILKTNKYFKTPQIWEVVWSPDDHHTVSFCYKARNGIINSLSGVFTVTRDMEVIGNVRDNPELLK